MADALDHEIRLLDPRPQSKTANPLIAREDYPPPQKKNPLPPLNPRLGSSLMTIPERRPILVCSMFR